MNLVGSEIKMVSEIGYGGTVDIVARNKDDEVIVIDLKTSKGVYDEYRLQLAAYCQMVKENMNLDYVPKAYILRIDKETGEFEHHRLGDLDKEWDIFLHALKIYRLHKEMKNA